MKVCLTLSPSSHPGGVLGEELGRNIPVGPPVNVREDGQLVIEAEAPRPGPGLDITLLRHQEQSIVITVITIYPFCFCVVSMAE